MLLVRAGVTFLRGGSCSFLTKNKLKSGTFNAKKVYKTEGARKSVTLVDIGTSGRSLGNFEILQILV